MIEIISTDKHEIWCRLHNIDRLDELAVEQIITEIDKLFENQERIYIQLNTMIDSSSGTISGLRQLMTYFFKKSGSVHFISPNEHLAEIVEYLSLSSDG